jgi:hypothetical protein
LFHSTPQSGLPIGNLTSQVFANFYVNSFDHFIKHDCGIRYYGRYVDDLILVHHDKAYLKALIPLIKATLQGPVATYPAPQENLFATLFKRRAVFRHRHKTTPYLHCQS